MEILERDNITDTIDTRIRNMIIAVSGYQPVTADEDQEGIDLFTILLDLPFDQIPKSAYILTLLCSDSIPVLKMSRLLCGLVREMRLRLIHLTIFPADPRHDRLSGRVSGCDRRDTGERERFIPSFDGEFNLPPEGENTNLTVTRPDYDKKKNLVRELIIDHEGYVVKEVSSYYTELYTDDSEDIFNQAYLKELKESGGIS